MGRYGGCIGEEDGKCRSFVVDAYRKTRMEAVSTVDEPKTESCMTSSVTP